MYSNSSTNIGSIFIHLYNILLVRSLIHNPIEIYPLSLHDPPSIMTGNLRECFINIGSCEPRGPQICMFIVRAGVCGRMATPWHWQEVSGGIRHCISVSLSVWTRGQPVPLTTDTATPSETNSSVVSRHPPTKVRHTIKWVLQIRVRLRGRNMNLQKYRVRTQWTAQRISYCLSWKRLDIDIVIYKVVLLPIIYIYVKKTLINCGLLTGQPIRINYCSPREGWQQNWCSSTPTGDSELNPSSLWSGSGLS